MNYNSTPSHRSDRCFKCIKVSSVAVMFKEKEKRESSDSSPDFLLSHQNCVGIDVYV
jgi:hypothetical protein